MTSVFSIHRSASVLVPSSKFGVQVLPTGPASCTTDGKCNRIPSGLELFGKTKFKVGVILMVYDITIVEI